MIVSVIGLGYVGLPTAILLASAGLHVRGVDINERLIELLQRGEFKIEDEKIQELYEQLVVNGESFSVGTTLLQSDVYIIAVPTPVRDRSIDLSYVETACKNIANVLRKGDLVILESTVAPGTTEGPVVDVLESTGLKAGVDFYLAHIPERVQPGNIYNELVYNERVIGGINTASTRKAMQLYGRFVKATMVETDAKTAETTKVIENTFRDVNIAIANEIAVLCEHIGVDPWLAIELANKHPRVNVLKPGPGVGGHCVPIDPLFLIEQNRNESLLLQHARNRNDRMPRKVADDIIAILKKIGKDRVALLGCTYKANSSDERESPTKVMVDYLESKGVQHRAYDPHLLRPWNCSSDSLEEAVQDVDLIVFVVPHTEFMELRPEDVARMTKGRIILDCTNSMDANAWKEKGFSLVRLGQVKPWLSASDG